MRASVTNAKDYIPRLCYAAREEDPTLNEQTIRDRVKTDCIALGLSSDYVRDCIPKEFKDKAKAKAGKKGKEKQEEQKIELLADGTPNPAQMKRAENDPEQPTGQDSKTSESQKEKPKTEENPLQIENDFLKEENANLKDAMSKMEQFKPATAFTEEDKETILVGPKEEYFIDWMRKRDNKISCFFYDAYGIDAFKNRELSQLKNSGVRVFKRLYFEV